MATESVLQFFDQYFPSAEITDADSAVPYLEGMGPERFYDLYEDTNRFFNNVSKLNTQYTYFADSKLSGLPMYCSAYSCRFQDLSQTSLFAALYTDKTLLMNPFSFAVFGMNPDNIELLLQEFSNAIYVAIFLAPLLEAGIVEFVSPYDGYLCEGCIEKLFPNDELSNFKDLALKYLYHTSEVKINDVHGLKTAIIDYNKIHGEHQIYAQVPPEYHSQLEIGQTLKLEEARKVGIFATPGSALMNDFYVRNIRAAEIKNANMLCNASEFNLVSQITGHNLVKDGFEINYPLLSSTRLREVIKMRNDEWHHFHKFRASVSDLKKSEELSNVEIQKIADDEFAKIATILEKVNSKAKGKFLKAGVYSTFGILGAIATAKISGPLAIAAALVGNGHATKETVEAFELKMQKPHEMMDSKFYFAWKASQKLR